MLGYPTNLAGFAGALEAFCRTHTVGVLFLDGSHWPGAIRNPPSTNLPYDELQAAIVQRLGKAIVNGDPGGGVLAGVDPIWEQGEVFEGLIAYPGLA